MLVVLEMGGFKTGGLNFDAKAAARELRAGRPFPIRTWRAWTRFARGLKIAAAIRRDGRLKKFVDNRYRSWDSGIGAKIESGKVGFRELEAYMLKQGEAQANESGRQEVLEAVFNEFI
jgi:xylose isomerase